MHDDNLIDLFAGLAMQGMLHAGWAASDAAEIADISYDMAEAMMKERKRRKEQRVNDKPD